MQRRQSYQPDEERMQMDNFSALYSRRYWLPWVCYTEYINMVTINILADMLADLIIDTPLTECMDIMSVDQTQQVLLAILQAIK